VSGLRVRRKRSARDVFQWISYLQYPALLVALGYAVVAGIAAGSVARTGWTQAFEGWNHMLLYAGIGIGLSSLQDPARTQNALSLRIWRDPRKGRWMLVLIAFYALGAMVLGLLGAHAAAGTLVNQLAFGLLAFGLGMVGLLKTAIEMREHHRLDRAPVSAAVEATQ